MFNVGGGELIVILLVALIVLGPQRLPDAARQLGKAMGDLRRMSTGFQNEVKQALDTADDPTRLAARRNVLATEVVPAVVADEAAAAEVREGATDPVIDDTGTVPEPEEDAAATSIAAVSAQPSTPATQTPPASQARAAVNKTTAPTVPEDPPPHTSA